MVAITCYPAECNLPPGFAYGNLTLRGRTIGDYFLQASGAANLQVQFDWSRQHLLQHPPDNRGLYDQNLLDGLTILLAPNASAPFNIGLIFCNNYLNGQGQPTGQYGVMFDLNAHGPYGPRQGCAVFLSPLWLNAQMAGVPPEGFAEFVTFTVIHELGHALNLWHTPGTCSFMEPHYDPRNLGPCDFIQLEKTYLSLAADPNLAQFVLPGQAPFNMRPPHWPIESEPPFATGKTPRAKGLTFRISLSHRSFWNFEPVELGIEIKSAGQSNTIPDEVDLGYNAFHVWVTDPTGARWRVRPQFRYCRPKGQRTIERGNAFRRDISLLRQSGGPVFSTPGVHTIQAALRLAPGEFVLSNVVQCEVRGAMSKDGDWAMAREILETESVVDLLRFKRRLPPTHHYRRLTELAGYDITKETKAAVHFALGKAMLRTIETQKDSDETGRFRTTGLQQLRAALEFDELGPHRLRVAREILRCNDE
jgi:hypothetical protein